MKNPKICFTIFNNFLFFQQSEDHEQGWEADCKKIQILENCVAELITISKSESHLETNVFFSGLLVRSLLHLA